MELEFALKLALPNKQLLEYTSVLDPVKTPLTLLEPLTWSELCLPEELPQDLRLILPPKSSKWEERWEVKSIVNYHLSP